jgi:hypothetical protein
MRLFLPERLPEGALQAMLLVGEFVDGYDKESLLATVAW